MSCSFTAAASTECQTKTANAVMVMTQGYLNNVQPVVSGEFGRGVSRHGLLDTVYPLREHLNNVQLMVLGEYCEGVFPDTVCWARLRNTWMTWGWILFKPTL